MCVYNTLRIQVEKTMKNIPIELAVLINFPFNNKSSIVYG